MTHNPDVVRRRRARTEAMGLRRVAAEPDAEAIVDPYSWTDPKRYLWLLGLIPAAAVLLAWGLRSLLGIWFSGWAIDWAWWGGPIVVFIIIPLLDYFIGNDGSNPSGRGHGQLEADKYYQWTLYAYIRCSTVRSSRPLPVGPRRPDVFDSFGLAMTAGVASGIGINTAMNWARRTSWNAAVEDHLAPTWYGHFRRAQSRPPCPRRHARDPASARWGELITCSSSKAWGSRSTPSSWRRSAPPARSAASGTRTTTLNAWAMSLVLYAALTAAFG